MARKKAKRKSIASTRLTDAELIAKLESEAPEVLRASIPGDAFEAVVEGLLKESSLSDDVPHFYCRPCGEYHLKTHPHHAEMKKRKRNAKWPMKHLSILLLWYFVSFAPTSIKYINGPYKTHQECVSACNAAKAKRGVDPAHLGGMTFGKCYQGK